LKRLADLLFTYLTEALGQDLLEVAEVLQIDYGQGGRRKDILPFLVDILPRDFGADTHRAGFEDHLPARQARHLTAG